MKKWIALLTALCLVFTCTCAMATSTFEQLQDLLKNKNNASDPASQEPAAEAEDGGFITSECLSGLTVVNTGYFIQDDSRSYLDLYLFVEVRNDGKNVVALDGSIQVINKDGAVVEDKSYLSFSPSVIAPGETAFLGDSLLISKDDGAATADEVGGVHLVVQSDRYASNPQALTYVESTAEVTQGFGLFGSATVMRVGVANTIDKPLIDPGVVAALYDDQGRLVYVEDASLGSSLATAIIPSGSSFVLDIELLRDFMEWAEQTDCDVASIVSYAYGTAME